MTKQRIPRLGTSVSVRFDPEEAVAVRATAARLRISYSELIRRAITAYTSPPTITAGSSTTVTVDFDPTEDERAMWANEVALSRDLP